MKTTKLIFSTDLDLDEFKKMEFESFEGDDELTEMLEGLDETQWYERLSDYLYNWLGDERMNLDKHMDKKLIAIADLGFWNGRKIGVKVLKDNLNSIFDVLNGYDAVEFYADRYNIHASLSHHDGTHYITFRCVDAKDIDKLEDKALDGSLTYEYAMRKTKSIVKHVNEIYGW